MTEKQMREYVDCGLANEQEFDMLKAIMQDVDYNNQEQRKFAYWTFCYHAGDVTYEEYKSAAIYKQAIKNGWI